jgi:hypothetical protein
MKKGRHQKIGSLNPADIAPSGLSFALACCIYRGRPQADLTDIHDPSLLPSDRSLSKRDSPRPIESRDGHSHSHTKTTLIIDSRPIRADKNSSGRAPRPSLSESHQFQFAASSYYSVFQFFSLFPEQNTGCRGRLLRRPPFAHGFVGLQTAGCTLQLWAAALVLDRFPCRPERRDAAVSVRPAWSWAGDLSRSIIHTVAGVAYSPGWKGKRNQYLATDMISDAEPIIPFHPASRKVRPQLCLSSASAPCANRALSSKSTLSLAGRSAVCGLRLHIGVPRNPHPVLVQGALSR